MPYCLGLHIDNNFIKYAKVLNEKDKEPKVEAYGVVCYENLNMAIENILKETSTYGAAEVATNLRNEFYNYFDDVFAGMPDSGMRKNLNLRFEQEICPKLNITPTSVESKYISSPKRYDEDTNEVIYISANKTDIGNSKKIVKGKVRKILPIPIANLSLLNIDNKSNFAILNIDSLSTLTIVLQGQVKKIVNINIGMSNILAKLNQKYNSYSKSYEKCKSITLYNENTKDLVIDDTNTEDIENVTPMLYDIAQRAGVVLEEYRGMINNLYITGDAVIINNIDLYFEGLIEDINCEILKPFFISNNPNLSNKIKDYTEVNSAIALAVASGRILNQNINFNTNGQLSAEIEAIKDNKVVSKISGAVSKVKDKVAIKKDEKESISKPKKEFSLKIGNSTLILQTVLWALVLATYIYSSNMVKNKYEENTNFINDEISAIQTKVLEVENDTKTITTGKMEYDRLIDKIETLNAELLEINGASYDVPRLLDGIAMVIPDKVTVTKITIDTRNQVKISAECSDYAELGFFVSRLKNEEVMDNISTSIENEEGSMIKITIMGEIL
ncbi:MAG: hypothetical protein E7311_04670 [Clostridiales bacterium]|nr:hypothetical protein [Clostridiales bacterium]